LHENEQVVGGGKEKERSGRKRNLYYLLGVFCPRDEEEKKKHRAVWLERKPSDGQRRSRRNCQGFVSDGKD